LVISRVTSRLLCAAIPPATSEATASAAAHQKAYAVTVDSKRLTGTETETTAAELKKWRLERCRELDADD
jgi:hypothetical protein